MTELRNQKVTAIGSVTGNGIDKYTQALNSINYEHHEIHAGKHFYIEGHVTLASGILPGLQVGLMTPNGSTWSHFTWHLSSNGIMNAYLYEDANISGGIATTPLNNNRNSPNTSAMTIYKACSGTGGTLVSDTSVGGTGFKGDVGGVAARTDELILKCGTTYRRDFYSASDDNIIAFKATWYEHTDKIQQF